MSDLPDEVLEAVGEAADNEMASQIERVPLSYAKVGAAALSALEAAGWEINRKDEALTQPLSEHLEKGEAKPAAEAE